MAAPELNFPPEFCGEVRLFPLSELVMLSTNVLLRTFSRSANCSGEAEPARLPSVPRFLLHRWHPPPPPR
jgi:hypothetical protein